MPRPSRAPRSRSASLSPFNCSAVGSRRSWQFGGERSSKPDTRLVAVVADARRWVCDLAEGRAASVRDLARQNNRDAADISRTLPLAFLAPAIIEAIME